MEACTTTENGLSTGQAADWRNDKHQRDQTCAFVHVYHSQSQFFAGALPCTLAFRFCLRIPMVPFYCCISKPQPRSWRRIHSISGDTFVVLVIHAKFCLKPTDLASLGCRCHEESSSARDFLNQGEGIPYGKRDQRKQTTASIKCGPKTFL